MYIIYGFKILKLIVGILGVSYFIGIFWYIMCDLYNRYEYQYYDKGVPFYYLKHAIGADDGGIVDMLAADAGTDLEYFINGTLIRCANYPKESVQFTEADEGILFIDPRTKKFTVNGTTDDSYFVDQKSLWGSVEVKNENPDAEKTFENQILQPVSSIYVQCAEETSFGNHNVHKMTETENRGDIQDDFLYHWDVVRWENDGDRALVMTYFAFTSLSTVGFGDFHPVNNFERILCAIIILFGNAIFGFIIGMFNEMISEMKAFESEMEDAEALNSFFTLIQKLNNGKPTNEKLKRDIEAFFEYKWNKDKSLAIKDEEDRAFLDQLPEDVQVAIITNFLYSDYLEYFRDFFTFFKNHGHLLQINTIRVHLFTW